MDNIDDFPSPPLMGRQDTIGCVDDYADDKMGVLMIGTGEYTTGISSSTGGSDKQAGVVGLCMLDLRRRGIVGRIGLCGTNGNKFNLIRNHMQKNIGDVYKDMDLTLECWPEEGIVDKLAYLEAIESFKPGDCCTIFTPDDTHYDIAMAAIDRGLHVMITKPCVKILEHHKELIKAANEKNVLVCVEVHKRWDPMYIDARDRIRNFGPFSYLYAYMSQPKHQLETFRHWAGKSSDISYYLNSHHIDFHEWCLQGKARPINVVATGSTGVATGLYNIDTEDTITLTVQWECWGEGKEDDDIEIIEDEIKDSGYISDNFKDNGKINEEKNKNEDILPKNSNTILGTAIYTSSWIAPKGEVHSQQRFFYMGHHGEINMDQAHRGYTMNSDINGSHQSINPLFMKYTPSNGYFSGQSGYGYRSFEEFINASIKINDDESKISDFDDTLATINTTLQTTAILEAGRLSLNNGSRPVQILYAPSDRFTPESIELFSYK